ncbi:hypothetical protein KY386_01290 [Candidatus Parcubacteria bacterium]|nr:hypothetical protein [Candidatus Parcubacteria bacterium]
MEITDPTAPATYGAIYDQAIGILSRYPRVEQITGSEFIGFPPAVVLVNTVKIARGEAGSAEIRATTAAARPAFEWILEITLDDKAGGLYKHYLLRDNDEIVEAYGRKVIPADEASAVLLAGTLAQVRAELESAGALLEPGQNKLAL